MLWDFGKIAGLAAMLAMLCAPVQANTSAAAPHAPLLLAQNDITIFPRGAEPPSGPAQAEPVPRFDPQPQGQAAPGRPARRIALVLPLRSEALGRAAGVVRAGFMASYERDREAGMEVEVVESGDAPEGVLEAYQAAATNADIVVGPLSRSGVALVAQRAVITKPTIVLSSTDALGDGSASLPSGMLAIGLSVEDEARQAARWAARDIPGGKAFVIATGTAWQQRAGRAFAQQWERLGLRQESMTLSAAGNFLDPNAMLQLVRRMQAERPDLVFVALDMVQTRQLREALGTDNDIAMYGTSQVNPVALPDWAAVQPLPVMNGVRLIDLPWQLLPEHPAVMSTPRLAVEPGQPRSADLERLYALGVDAWRVAREIALGRTRFALDGVTGKLDVDFAGAPARFERVEAQGVYQDGVVMPFAAVR